jgi:HK97 family phage major capsid protein
VSILQALRDRRAVHAREARALLDNSSGWSADQDRRYNLALREIEALDTQISACLDVLERTASGRISDALEQYAVGRFIDPDLRAFIQTGEIRNTMSTTTSAEGGYTVPALVAERATVVMKDYSSMRRLSEVFRTERGGAFTWPTSDGTSELGEQLNENVGAASQDPTFGGVGIPTYKYSSKVFAVPFELLQDSALDMEGFIFRRAAERIGRITNQRFTTGTGSGQPQGFVGVANAGKVGTTGQTTTVTHDDLVDLVHSVNAAHRYDPRARPNFSMADATFKVARKLKDATTNRPVYLPSDGVQPETILGYPVDVNDDVPTPAANAKSIFFGNFFNGYKVRDAMLPLLFRFSDSAFAKLGQVGFLMIARCGGNLVDPAAVKYYQHSAT